MDLKEALLKEHSKKNCDAIVAYIGSNPERFARLMELFFHGEYRVTQRASWPMSYCVQNHPELIVPYLTALIGNLRKKGLHDAIIRNTLRLLQHIDVPRKQHGRLMSICFEYVESPPVPVAIKAFALTVLHRLSKVYPEIIPELKLIIEERMDNETAAFRQRAVKIIRN